MRSVAPVDSIGGRAQRHANRRFEQKGKPCAISVLPVLLFLLAAMHEENKPEDRFRFPLSAHVEARQLEQCQRNCD
jgi:hypothetical protein